MTRHPVRLEQLLPDLREGAPTDDRGRVDRPSREFRAEVFARFHAALEPFARKLGGSCSVPVLRGREGLSRDYIAWAVGELRGDRPLVEFRHRSWLDDEHRDHTLSFLESLGASHVVVDAPKTDAKNLVPTVPAVTGPLAYVRFHGRNADTWNKRGGARRAVRLPLLGGRAPGMGLVLEKLADEAREAYAMFNNNGRSPAQVGADREWFAQAPVNALSLIELLG